MSALDGLKAVASRQQGKGDKPLPMRTVALKVSGYEEVNGQFYVKGTDLETGEEVKAFLRKLPDEQAAKLKKPRPSLADFKADPQEIQKILANVPEDLKANILKGIPHKTEPGGVIVLDSCFPDKKNDNALSSRWVTPVSKFEGIGATVMFGMTRLNHMRVHEKGDAKTVSVTATVAHVDKAKQVQSLDELKDALLYCLGRPNGAGAIVRSADGENVVPMELYRGFEPAKEGEEIQLRDPQQALDHWLNSEAGRALSGILEAQPEGVTYEIIPTNTLSMGSATKQAIKNPKALENYDMAYRAKTVKEGFTRNGFRPSLITCFSNKGEAGLPHVFSSVKPTSNQSEVKVPESLDTPFIKGLDITVPEPASAANLTQDDDAPESPVSDHDGVDLSEYVATPAPESEAGPAKPQQPRARHSASLGM